MDSLIYIVSSRPPKAIQCDLVSKKKIRKREETRYGNIYLKVSTQEPEAGKSQV